MLRRVDLSGDFFLTMRMFTVAVYVMRVALIRVFAEVAAHLIEQLDVTLAGDISTFIHTCRPYPNGA